MPRRVRAKGAGDGLLRLRRGFAGQLHRRFHHCVRQPVSVVSDDLEDGANHREMTILLGLEQDADGTRDRDPQLAGGSAAGPVVDDEQSPGLQGQADRLLLSHAEAGCQTVDLSRRL